MSLEYYAQITLGEIKKDNKEKEKDKEREAERCYDPKVCLALQYRVPAIFQSTTGLKYRSNINILALSFPWIQAEKE